MTLIINPTSIFKSYLKSWLIPDLAACLPLTYIIGANKKYSKIVRMAFLPRLYKLIKITKMMPMFKVFGNSTGLSRYMRDFFQISILIWMQTTKLAKSAMLAARFKVDKGLHWESWMLLTFLLLMHLVACFWYLLGRQNLTNENWIFKGGYTDKDPLDL